MVALALFLVWPHLREHKMASGEDRAFGGGSLSYVSEKIRRRPKPADIRRISAHSLPATGHCDRRNDEVVLGEVEQISI
jgi:hypothetical protein